MSKGDEVVSTKKVVVLILGMVVLLLVVGGCGAKETSLTVGKEATVTAASFVAKDETNGKKMVELLQSENDMVLGKLMQEKTIDPIDEGAKVKVVSQKENMVKANYKGKDVFLWVKHLKQ